MFGTMLDAPLSVSRLLVHAGERHASATVSGLDSDLSPSTVRFDVVASRAAALAHALGDLGVGPSDVVAVLSDNRTEYVEALFAVPSMGAVALPVNVRLPGPDIARALTERAVTVLLVDPPCLDSVPALVAAVPGLEHVVVFGTRTPEGPPGVTMHSLETLLDGRSTTYDWPSRDERSAAVISYTSGTTGRPRAVAFSHRSIWLHSMQTCSAESAALGASDTVLSTVPLFHVMSWGLPFSTFMAGSSLVLNRPRSADPVPSGRMLAAMAATHRPTKMATTPVVLLGLLRHLDEHPQNLGHLREILVGGSAVPPALFDAFAERHGITLLQAFGLTESSPLIAVARPDPRSSATERREQMLGQGRLPAGVDARVVDAGRPQPHDGSSIGELQIRGPWVSARYLDDPDDEAGHFEEGWLRTGDLAAISPKGYLTFFDRVDDAIASGGEWISSVQLENAVMRDDRVAEAAVVGVPDQRWGHRPLVVVRLKPGVVATARSLWNHLGDAVELWRRPDHWALVDGIPRTTLGKFDKKLIRERHARGDYHVTTIAPGARD